MKVNRDVQTEWQNPADPASTARQQPTTATPATNTGGGSRFSANALFSQLTRRSGERSAEPSGSGAGTMRTLGRRFKELPRTMHIVPPRARISVGTQTGIMDIHNHSDGPGYGPTQIYDVTLRLAENIRKQMDFFDQAGVDKYVLAPIPTVVIDGKAIAAGCCSTDDHDITPGHTHLDENAPSTDRRTYYMPDSYRFHEPMTGEAFHQITEQGKQHYNTSVDWQVGKAYSELRAEDAKLPPHKQLTPRIFPAITGINLGDANSVMSMLMLKKEYPDTFHIVGEITMHKEFVDRQNVDYTPEFGPEAPINDILKFSARSGMPVVLHCDSSDAARCIEDGAVGQGEYFADIEALVARHPDTTIVHAHMGGIGKFAPPGEHHIQQLEHLLATYPNYHLDMSWDVVAENYSPHSKIEVGDEPPATDTEAHEAWKQRKTAKTADEADRHTRMEAMAALINKYPDRFIMGSDALITRNATSITATYDLYSGAARTGDEARPLSRKTGLFDYLPPDSTLPMVLSGNFNRILDKAKVDSKAYEDGQMKQDLQKIQSAAVDNGRTPNVWELIEA